MPKATASRRYRLSVWLIWLLVVLIMGLQPSLMPTHEADAVASGTSVVLTARPGRELFPWWPRGRWRQRAVTAYRRWQRARRQAPTRYARDYSGAPPKSRG
ncbi:MAG: hypothetical protein KKA73_07165 [Chloroflexi bacterium]|nr:hypothetical protein [Chloroflexota bacterium]MBU1878118.1 hypothetical protein [Chloroflexota bacterium]